MYRIRRTLLIVVFGTVWPYIAVLLYALTFEVKGSTGYMTVISTIPMIAVVQNFIPFAVLGALALHRGGKVGTAFWFAAIPLFSYTFWFHTTYALTDETYILALDRLPLYGTGIAIAGATLGVIVEIVRDRIKVKTSQ